LNPIVYRGIYELAAQIREHGAEEVAQRVDKFSVTGNLQV
jgi:hypothetical protein